MPTHQNIVVHRKAFTLKGIDLFRNFSNLLFYNSDEIENVVRLFLNADVIVTKGSSLPSLLAWFKSPQQPVVIEEPRHYSVEDRAKYKYVGTKRDTFHISNGDFLYNQTFELYNILRKPLHQF